MTWKEFKERVDGQLKGENASDDCEIFSIRIKGNEEPLVTYDSFIGLRIMGGAVFEIEDEQES